MLRAGVCPVFTIPVLKALKSCNVNSVVDFLSADLECLSQKSGICYKDILAIKRVLIAQHSSFTVCAKDLYNNAITSIAILSVGCNSLNELLDGGLYTNEITEIAGSFASGKSQICLSAAVEVSKETQKNVIYIDTGGDFDLCRIQEILETSHLSEKEMERICQRIKCSKVFDVFELLTELQCIKTHLSQQSDPFYSSLKLIIVDCVAAVLSPILGSQQTDGHGYMSHVAKALKTLASEFSLAVLITNNTVLKDGVARPSLGKSWQSVPNTRLQLTKDGYYDPMGKYIPAIERQAVLTKSFKLPIGAAAKFRITSQGLSSS